MLVWRTVLEPRRDVSGRPKVAIDPAEATIAWQLGWERETRVGFTDAETGTLLGYRRKQLMSSPSPAPRCTSATGARWCTLPGTSWPSHIRVESSS
jgi:hypothetical protein